MTVDDLFTQTPEPPQAPPPGDQPPGEPVQVPPPSHRRRLWVLLAVVAVLIALVAGLATWYLRTGKPLSQLPGLAQGAQPPHYLFSVYGVTQPLGVAVGPDGDRIYVTESGGPRLVHVFDRTGHPQGTLKPPDTTGAAHTPVYVAVDPKTRDVYVSDRMTGAVYVYGEDGHYLRTFAPKGDLAGWAPLGLAFDAQEHLYVSDVRAKGAQRVLQFSTDGTLLRTFGETVSLTYPNGIAVDARGYVEVCDSNNARVVVFAPDGTVIGRIVGGSGDNDIGLPRGAAVDDGKRLYVVDVSNHVVRMFKIPDAATGIPQYVNSFGTEGTTDGAFEYPNGVAADSRARLYVTDRENDRLQVWSY